MSTLELPTSNPAVVAPAAPRPRLTALTRLRWVAALLVFAYHIRNFQIFGGDDVRALISWAFRGGGAIGVSLFFVLSGFIIAWSTKPGVKFGTFLWRRFARIYPLHLVTALIFFALVLFGVTGLRDPVLNDWLVNLSLINAWSKDWWQTLNPVSWSLSVEALFYVCFPLAYAAARRMSSRMLAVAMGVMVVAVFVIAVSAEHHWITVDIYTYPPARLPEFLAGVAAGLIVRRGDWRGPSVAMATGITLIGYFLGGQVPYNYSIASCTVIGAVLLIPALAGEQDKTGRWASVGERLGEWSFAFYLIHLLVIRVAVWFTGQRPQLDLAPALLVTVGILTVAIFASWLLHRFVENPVRKLLLRR